MGVCQGKRSSVVFVAGGVSVLARTEEEEETDDSEVGNGSGPGGAIAGRQSQDRLEDLESGGVDTIWGGVGFAEGSEESREAGFDLAAREEARIGEPHAGERRTDGS
jgi:hypothetical protein